jgi:hypothetical protein
MLGHRWQIRTPLGEFWLEVSQAGSRFPAADERQRAQRVWFFAERQLHNLEPDAIGAALELCAELGRARDWQRSRTMDRWAAEALARELEMALLSGRLVLKERPRFESSGAGLEAKEASRDWAPKPRPPDPQRSSEEAWIELELCDPQGNPLAFRTFRVSQNGRVVREGTTNGNGFARVEGLVSGACDIEFTDLDVSDFNPQPALPGAAPADSVGPVAIA